MLCNILRVQESAKMQWKIQVLHIKVIFPTQTLQIILQY